MNSNKTRTYPFLLVFLLALVLVTVNAIAMAGGVSESDRSPNAPNEMVWAENVRDHQLGEGVGANFSDPGAALGEADAVPGVSGIFSLGNALNAAPQPPLLPSQCEAYLIVDFGEHFIFDGPGADIEVFEVAANGVAEATWVYVGRDEGESQLWLYAGQTGGSTDTVDISAIADVGEVFNLVALCDYPDGISSGSPVGGPDIDAIAALHSRRMGLAAQADGPGWSKNEEALATGETTPLDEGDNVTFECPDGAGNEQCQDSALNVQVTCIDPDQIFSQLRIRRPRAALEVISDLMAITEILPELEEACRQGNVPVLGPPAPMAIFAIEEGFFDFSVQDDIWRFRLDTPVAQVSSVGTNDFLIRYDSQSNEALVRVSAGILTVDPGAAGADPFDLQAGQQVTIDAGGAGPVIDLSFSYLPLTLRH